MNKDFDLWTRRVEDVGMLSINNTYELDTSLFDDEHDMDLVLLLSNARTDAEFEDAVRISRNRMRNRRAALRAARSPRRRSSAARLRRLTPSLRSRA